MRVLKRIERLAKVALALTAGMLLWRPWRGRRRFAPGASKILLVRIDDRLGEVLLLTPLLAILKEAIPGGRVDALVHLKRASILAGHPQVDRVISFDSRALILGPLAPGIRRLRREKYDAVVDCANWTDPSVRSAIVARLACASNVVVGPAAFPVARLYSVPVAARAGTVSELEQRAHLLSPLVPGAHPARLTFRAPRPSDAIQRLVASLPARRYAVVNPGGRLDWRRLPPSTFAAAANALAGSGLRPVITWGPAEADLASAVAKLSPQSVVAPPTDVDDLAALIQSAALTVCNNTGPMHLSVALGTPTLAFFLKMAPERWGHPYPPHRMIDVTLVPSAELDARIGGEARQFAERLCAERRPGR